MRSAILLLFVCFATFAQTPSQYHVVRVVGKVESPALNRELKTGDVIQAKDHLRFGTKESYIIVNSPQTGRKRISGVPDNSPREFIQLLQSFVQPDTRSTSTRHVSMAYVESLQNSMAYDTLLILGDGFIPVNTKKLSLEKPAVVRASYHDENKKRIYESISSSSGFTIAQTFATRRIIVEYFEDEKEEPSVFTPAILLGAFVPVFANETQLASELKALIAAREKNRTVLGEVHSYLLEEYAPAQEDNLKAWLKQQGIAY